MPTILLCARRADFDGLTFDAAATRAGAELQLVTDDTAATRGAITASFAREPEAARAALDALRGTPVDGIIPVGDAAGWLAATLAQSLEVPLHAPAAVALAGDALRARGRWMAAGLLVPWFVTVPAHGDTDLDRLTRLRFPCVVRVAGLPASRVGLRCDSLDEVMTSRARLAAWLSTTARLRDAADDDTLLIEGEVAGPELVLVGVLELGALRVFALFERVVVGATTAAEIHVTPARFAPARQQVIAAHIARAAFALGLHHGPIEATCRLQADDVVVLDVAPRAARGWLAGTVPVVSPARDRCTLADVLVAHALGRSLEHYGHQAMASGVLRIGVPTAGRLVGCEPVGEMAGSPWVTSVETLATIGDRVHPAPEGGPVLQVRAAGAHPDDVVGTLAAAALRLQVTVDADV